MPFNSPSFLTRVFIRDDRSNDSDFDYIFTNKKPEHLVLQPELLVQAASGDLEATYQFGKFHVIDPYRIIADIRQGAFFLKESGSAGDPRAQYAYAQLLIYSFECGDYELEEPKTIINLLKTAGEAGNVHAQFLLADGYSLKQVHELDLYPDRSEGLYWWRKCALQGVAKAQCQYAYMLFESNEWGDRIEGAYWLHTSHLSGHPGADVEFLDCVKWLAPTADDDAYAAHVLGLANYHGTGLIRDAVKAEELFLQAIDQGHSESLACLGELYWNGHEDGVVSNKDKAIELLQEAAKKGVPRAKECLLSMKGLNTV
jgi:TPR repeat protein